MNKYTYFQGTRQGGRSENQDAIGTLDTKAGLLLVVCDGMGGANGGKTASRLAVDTILEAVSAAVEPSPAHLLSQAIKKANEAVYKMSQSVPELRGMGTTVVALLINDEGATTAHVGDSRIYQVRGEKKVFRTFDHSMVFELVKRGKLSEEQARLSAESNVILRAIGTKPDVEVEINERIPYRKGDRFLLCSDGISGAVSEKELCKLVNADASVEKTISIITETIDDIGMKNGGKHDNLSAVLVEINENNRSWKPLNKRTLIGITLAVVCGLSVLCNVILLLESGRKPRQEAVKQAVTDTIRTDPALRDTMSQVVNRTQ